MSPPYAPCCRLYIYKVRQRVIEVGSEACALPKWWMAPVPYPIVWQPLPCAQYVYIHKVLITYISCSGVISSLMMGNTLRPSFGTLPYRLSISLNLGSEEISLAGTRSAHEFCGEGNEATCHEWHSIVHHKSVGVYQQGSVHRPDT